jgi:pyruvate kinase
MREMTSMRRSADIVAKLERRKAIANLESISTRLTEVMVARGDLGVEMSQRWCPSAQKAIIPGCQPKG